MAEKASLTKAGHVRLSNATDSNSESFAATAKAVKAAMDRADAAFTSASNGKQAVGNAITGVDDEVVIPIDPTYQELADAIGKIETGKKWASGESEIIDGEILVADLEFAPSIVVVSGEGYYKSTPPRDYYDGSMLAVMRLDNSLYHGSNNQTKTSDSVIASHTFDRPGTSQSFQNAHGENFVTEDGFIIRKSRGYEKLKDGGFFFWWAFE